MLYSDAHYPMGWNRQLSIGVLPIRQPEVLKRMFFADSVGLKRNSMKIKPPTRTENINKRARLLL